MKSDSNGYGAIQSMLDAEECVILDGGVSTELERVGLKDHAISDKTLWGEWALYHAPLEVHRRFASAGCHVISTDTWGAS